VVIILSFVDPLNQQRRVDVKHVDEAVDVLGDHTLRKRRREVTAWRPGGSGVGSGAAWFPRPSFSLAILCQPAENRGRQRGGQFEITSLHTSAADPAVDPAELSRISDALDQLAATDPALAEIVDLKFFRSFAELAAIRQVSERTLLRIREKARIYLYNAISATLDG